MADAEAAGADRPSFGHRDEKGHWRPPYPVRFAPVFTWPPKPRAFLKWLFGYPGFIFPLHLFFSGLAAATWFFFQPALAAAQTLAPGWILLMLLRNLILLWIVAGGLHLVLYQLKLHGSERKYNPRWQETNSKKYLFNNQVFDNVFRSNVFGATIWTAWEVLYIHGLALGWFPTIMPQTHLVWFIALFLLIPLWRELHFYLIHRLIHWRPLFRTIHKIHHLNPNPGPWTGLAMHPIEHLLYFSVVAIHFIVPSHPIHFLFNSQLTALTPALGHHGFEGPLFNGKFITGSYFHYLHHKHVSCNFGEATVPMDKWFGRFYDGEGPYRTKAKPEPGTD